MVAPDHFTVANVWARMQEIKVVDSHTAGEPTRIIIDGGPSSGDLGGGSLADRLAKFRDKFDSIRSAVVNEPRGSDVLVGGLLCEPVDPSCAAGIIFFNNTGYLGMCGHGTIGLMETLKFLGRIESGVHKIETPVGIVAAELFADGQVAIENVPSYRLTQSVSVEVPELGLVTGDVAWGGNWFFLVKEPVENLDADRRHLTEVALKIRHALQQEGITGVGGAEIDHVELFGPPLDSKNHSRNFVLCPGGAYDRSPCGTGTSAKLACLAADGKLAAGELWRQESILGTVFECSYQVAESNPNQVLPTIRARAFVSGQSTLILNPDDPFCMGIPS